MKYTSGKRICIVTQSHLCRNPRVVKEALALANTGYEVIIINSTYNSALTKEDQHLINHQNIKTIPVSSLEIKGINTFTYKLFKKVGDLLIRYFGTQTPLTLGYASWRYKSAALKQNADLYICHQELGLYCGVQLLNSKKKVAFDFEDWYSEDLLDEARRYRPIRLLRELEKTALQKGIFCFTTSNALACKLAEVNRCNVPATIYNTFDADEAILSRQKSFVQPLKLFWFSQTTGPGRGLEPFLELIDKIDVKLEIHLLGNVDEHYMKELSAIQHTYPVFFHPLVPSTELAERIADFDIGLALEKTYPLSRNLTITNKFFQYIQSGLPVIATPTLGQMEIFNVQSAGFLIDTYNSPKLIEKLKNWLTDTRELNKARENAIQLAHKYNQDTQYAKLLKLTANAI